MEKIVKLGEQEVRLKSTAASLIKYKANFGRDGLADIFAFRKALKNGKTVKVAEVGADKIDLDTLNEEVDIEKIDFDTFLRYMWVYAKSANPAIPPFEEWLDQFELSDMLTGGLPAVVELMGSTAATHVNPAKN